MLGFWVQSLVDNDKIFEPIVIVCLLYFSCLFVCYAWHAHLLICFSLVSCGLVRPPELLALTPHLALTNTIASPRGWNKPFIWNLDLTRRLLNIELVEIIDKGSNCGVSLARAFTTKECYRSWTWEARRSVTPWKRNPNLICMSGLPAPPSRGGPM